jgi:hypothetical protein
MLMMGRTGEKYELCMPGTSSHQVNIISFPISRIMHAWEDDLVTLSSSQWEQPCMEHGSLATENKICHHKRRRSHHLFIILEGAEEGHINQILHEELIELKNQWKIRDKATLRHTIESI